MEIKEIIKNLENNQRFKEWKKDNNFSSLVHVFKLLDEPNKDAWQIGFYNPNDTITTFVISKDIKIIPTEKIFKKPDSKIKKLDIEKINIDWNKALDLAQKLQKETYPAEKPIKTILILQNLDIQVYNITLLTESFKTLNIKIDSDTGKIVSHDLKSLADFANSPAS